MSPGRVDVPSYTGVHLRLRRKRGPASDYRCVLCGKQAMDWALLWPNGSEVTETRNRPERGHPESIAYSVDPAPYAPLCRRCHWHLDHRR